MCTRSNPHAKPFTSGELGGPFRAIPVCVQSYEYGAHSRNERPFMPWADHWTVFVGVPLSRCPQAWISSLLGNLQRVSSCFVLRDRVRILDLVSRWLVIFAEVGEETLRT